MTRQSIRLSDIGIIHLREIEEMMNIKGIISEEVPAKQLRNRIFRRWRGDGDTIPGNFVVTLYSSRNGYTACPSDMVAMQAIIRGENPWLETGTVIQIDDSGWGCPVGGVMIGGLVVGEPDVVHTIVPCSEFRDNEPSYYLQVVASQVVKIIKTICDQNNLNRNNAIIDVCSGPVLIQAREVLDNAGWRTRTQKIRGRLQDVLKVEYQQHLIDSGIPPDLVDKDYQLIFAWASERSFPDIKWNGGEYKHGMRSQIDWQRGAEPGAS